MAVIVLVVLAGCGSSGHTSLDTSPPPGAARISVSSPDLRNGGTVPRRFTCDGGGARPALSWSAVPPEAAEVAVLVGDPDAPGGTFVHWTVWGLRPSVRSLGSGALPAGAVQGANSAGGLGWTPPCPPKGNPPHRYVFAVYALKRQIKLASGADSRQAVETVRAAAIGAGSLTARYGR